MPTRLSMKAVLCHQFGPPEQLVYEERPIPTINESQILIEVKASALNFPDSLLIQGKYQFKPAFPFSPGGEVAGIIQQVGNQVKGFQKGDRVVALTGWGGFAQYCVTQPSKTFALSPAIDFQSAAAFLYTYGTVFHALKDRGQLKEGETLLILGAAGGIGLAAVELGKQMGATVIAAASSMEKGQVCLEKGADSFINYSEENLKKRVRELAPEGVSVVLDPVGGSHSEQALRTLRGNGRFLVVGFASGEIPKIPLNLPLLKSCQIVGVFWSAFAQQFPERNKENIQQLLAWMEQGQLSPRIDQVFPFAQAANAIKKMENRAVKGKIVLIP